MFEDLIRELQRLERRVRIPIKLPVDADGYLDRQCPQRACEFKVLLVDWKDKVRDEGAYCPRCGAKAVATQWNTPDQRRTINQQALAYTHRRVTSAIDNSVRRFNAKQPRQAFVSMRLSHRPGAPPVVLPSAAADAMEQKLTCESCGCRYASVGTAFFCPACGHNSAISMLKHSVAHFRQTVAGLAAIRDALAASHGADMATDTERRLVENALEDLVTTFQRFAEARSGTLSEGPKARMNLFQTVEEASTYWRTVSGRGYEDVLEAAELADFRRYASQRHVLAHRDGIVDERYIASSGDNSYEVGQRLVVRGSDVTRLADLVEKLANWLHTVSPETREEVGDP